jgi:hypothetical protein
MSRICFEGLMHVWRVTAYYMGVDDVANLVKDSYEETAKLLIDLGHYIALPAILNIDATSIVMGKNVAKSADMDYYVIIYMASQGDFSVFCSSVPNKHGFDAFSLWSRTGNVVG